MDGQGSGFPPLAPGDAALDHEALCERFSSLLYDHFLRTDDDHGRTPEEVEAAAAAEAGGSSKRCPRFRGITKHKRTQRFEAHLWEAKKQVYLGGFSREVDAAKSHDLMSLRCKGADTLLLNFPADEYAELLPFVPHLSQEEIISALRAYSRAQAAAARGPGAPAGGGDATATAAAGGGRAWAAKGRAAATGGGAGTEKRQSAAALARARRARAWPAARNPSRAYPAARRDLSQAGDLWDKGAGEAAWAEDGRQHGNPERWDAGPYGDSGHGGSCHGTPHARTEGVARITSVSSADSTASCVLLGRTTSGPMIERAWGSTGTLAAVSRAASSQALARGSLDAALPPSPHYASASTSASASASASAFATQGVHGDPYGQWILGAPSYMRSFPPHAGAWARGDAGASQASTRRLGISRTLSGRLAKEAEACARAGLGSRRRAATQAAAATRRGEDPAGGALVSLGRSPVLARSRSLSHRQAGSCEAGGVEAPPAASWAHSLQGLPLSLTAHAALRGSSSLPLDLPGAPSDADAYPRGDALDGRFPLSAALARASPAATGAPSCASPGPGAARAPSVERASPGLFGGMDLALWDEEVWGTFDASFGAELEAASDDGDGLCDIELPSPSRQVMVAHRAAEEAIPRLGSAKLEGPSAQALAAYPSRDASWEPAPVAIPGSPDSANLPLPAPLLTPGSPTSLGPHPLPIYSATPFAAGGGSLRAPVGAEASPSHAAAGSGGWARAGVHSSPVAPMPGLVRLPWSPSLAAPPHTPPAMQVVSVRFRHEPGAPSPTTSSGAYPDQWVREGAPSWVHGEAFLSPTQACAPRASMRGSLGPPGRPWGVSGTPEGSTLPRVGSVPGLHPFHPAATWVGAPALAPAGSRPTSQQTAPADLSAGRSRRPFASPGQAQPRATGAPTEAHKWASAFLHAAPAPSTPQAAMRMISCLPPPLHGAWPSPHDARSYPSPTLSTSCVASLADIHGYSLHR